MSIEIGRLSRSEAVQPGFPTVRMRRMRRTAALRGLVRETRLDVSSLIYPLFVAEGHDLKHPISSMPGQFNWSLDRLGAEIEEVVGLGIPAVLLFGLPAEKDPRGSGAYDPQGVVQRAIRAIKRQAPDLVVIGDVCLCEYTDHGHCGIVADDYVQNDPTIELLARMAVAQVEAGADVVAPSDMMDGRVQAIRRALDEAGFCSTPILSYSAKYASAFYGPFREAANSAPQFGDRRSHQMDPPNRREALRAMEQDLLEGADAIMVKPALAYLDVITAARQRFDVPIAAYNVSGEYAMVKAAAANGWIDERRIVTEVITGIRRAGADMVITYFAKDLARWAALESAARTAGAGPAR